MAFLACDSGDRTLHNRKNLSHETVFNAKTGISNNRKHSDNPNYIARVLKILSSYTRKFTGKCRKPTYFFRDGRSHLNEKTFCIGCFSVRGYFLASFLV